MLIVELKAPSVKLSFEVYTQLEKYVHTIRKEPRFNSRNCNWKFYAICAEIEDDVKSKYKNFEDHGKRGLVNIIENFEMYALSWADIFQSFEARHTFLLDKLKIDRTQALRELETSENSPPSRAFVDEISNKIVTSQAI